MGRFLSRCVLCHGELCATGHFVSWGTYSVGLFFSPLEKPGRIVIIFTGSTGVILIVFYGKSPQNRLIPAELLR